MSTPQNPEQAINNRLLVTERLHAHNADFVIALADHSAENMPAIAAALLAADCDAIAIEAPGLAKDETHRRMVEEAFSKLVSNDVSEQQANQALEYLKGNPLEALLKQLLGSGKRIKLLDVAQNDPNYDAAQHGWEARVQLVSLVASFQAPSRLGPTVVDTAQAIANSNAVRDKTMAQQLQKLSQQPGAQKIGVVLGATHVEALALIGAQTDKLSSLIKRHNAPLDEIVRHVKNNKPISEATINKAMLQLYLSMHGGNTQTANKAVTEFDEATIKRYLDQIETIAAQPINDEEKVALLTDLNKAIISFL